VANSVSRGGMGSGRVEEGKRGEEKSRGRKMGRDCAVLKISLRALVMDPHKL